MKRQQMLKIAAIPVLASTMMSATNVFADSPMYKNNEYTEAYISEIDFSNKVIRAAFRADAPFGYPPLVDTGSNTMSAVFQYGPMTDEQLVSWDGGRVSGNTLISSAIMGPDYASLVQSGESFEISSPLWRGGSIDLLNNNYDRIEYLFWIKGTAYRGRADYNRCVKSSVFLSGQAIKCRAEVRADGMLQYQPYDGVGNRLEIDTDEDDFLSNKTDTWVAGVSPWTDDWYHPDAILDIPDIPDTPDNPDAPSNPDMPDNPDEPDVPNTPDEPGNPSAPDMPDNPDEPSATNITNGSDISDMASDAEGISDSSLSNPDRSYSSDNRGSGINHLANYVTIASSSRAQDSDESDSSSNGSVDGEQDNSALTTAGRNDNSLGNESSPEDIDTPLLGKESEQSGNLLASILIIVALLMAAVGWWLLFFGKNKLTEGKEKKKCSHNGY